MEASISRFNRYFLDFGASLILSSLAVGFTYYISLFTRIPWTLSFLAVAMVAWIGGVAPSLLAALIMTCAIYGLILAPAHHNFYDPAALIQTIAFDLVAFLIASLLSQRNRARSSVEASEMHYRSVTETASDVVITIDSASRILSINPAVKDIFGYEPGELIGEQMPILMRFTGFIRDVSDRRETEAALLKSEKLAAVGRLASSIAHEINNPLEAITNLIYLCRGSRDITEIQSYLETAEREVRRISVIANQTLQFHRQSSTPEAVTCNGLVNGCLSLYQGRLLNARISVEQRHRADRLPICIEGEIRQVLNNLLGNAIDALPDQGGRILIRARNATEWKDRRIGVVLTIADTGTGMSPETREKLFDAFFTTKGIGGTGLGLWISGQLVERNQGKLRVRSSQRYGRSGTVFTLFLPCFGDQ